MNESLKRALDDSKRSLGRIGDGDWTPQDSAHHRLVLAVEDALDSSQDRTCLVCGGLGAVPGFWLGTSKTCPACHGRGEQ